MTLICPAARDSIVFGEIKEKFPDTIALMATGNEAVENRIAAVLFVTEIKPKKAKVKEVKEEKGLFPSKNFAAR